MSPSIRGRQERPDMKTPDDVMTLTEHLGELRVRIIRAALAVTIGAIIIIAFYDPVLDFLTQPYIDLCVRKGPDFCGFDASTGEAPLNFLDPVEGLSTRLRIGTYGGLILAMPVVLWQIWRFIVPALHKKEKQYAIPFILTSVALFLLGGLLAYLTLEKALEFLIAWSGDDVQPLFQISKYVRLVVLMVAAFGVGFQFPVLLVFLQLAGVITPQQLLRSWRYVHPRHRRPCRGHHALRRPDLARRARRADDPAVLHRRAHRLALPAAQPSPHRLRLRDWSDGGHRRGPARGDRRLVPVHARPLPARGDRRPRRRPPRRRRRADRERQDGRRRVRHRVRRDRPAAGPSTPRR